LRLALLVATAINAFLAATVAQLAWNQAHCHIEAWADFGVAMRIAGMSLPISALCLVGLVIGVVFRFAAGGVFVPSLRPSVMFLAVVNILAPVLLWYALEVAPHVIFAGGAHLHHSRLSYVGRSWFWFVATLGNLWGTLRSISKRTDFVLWWTRGANQESG
jgi:hypothetical protein